MQTKEGIKGIIKIVAAVCAVLVMLITPVRVKGAELFVEFGSNWYDKNSGDEFSVCAYLRSDVALTEYTLEVEYDQSRLKYVSGASDVDEYEGVLVCKASGDHMLDIKVWLTFDATSGGDAYINIISAKATDENGNEYIIDTLDEAPVHLKGEDVAEANLNELEAQHSKEADSSTSDGTDTTVEDGNNEMPENNEAPNDNAGNAATDTAEAGNAATDTAEAGNADSVADINEVGAPQVDTGDNGTAVAETTGIINNAITTSGGIAILQNTKNAALYYWLIVAAIIIILVTIVVVSTNSGRKRLAKKREQLEMVEIDDSYSEEFEFSEYDEDLEGDFAEDSGEEPDGAAYSLESENIFESEANAGTRETEEIAEIIEAERREAEIKQAEKREADKKEIDKKTSDKTSLFEAKGVTVAVKVPVSKASGVGEYLSDKVSEKAETEYINILEDISISIHRGEIVEVTGKGKRELEAFIGLLLGKCKPSEGTVSSNIKRCRVVTARSCFDMKLSGRANIYRSGALMGHPKAVLDKCYNRIVKFAGADGLMEAPAGELSMSIINKLEVALALLDDQADMIILGNVLGECDESFIRRCNAVLGKMAEKNMTVLLIGRIPEDIAVNCSRTIRIDNGHIVKV